MTREAVFFEDYYGKGRDAWEIFSDDVRREKFTQRLRFARAFLGSVPNENVLDVGCGEGFVANQLGVGVIGLDISGMALRSAIGRKAIRHAIRANSISLPVKSSSLDAVIMLETIYYNDADKMLSEVGRVLKPGGHLILSVGNKWSVEKLYSRLKHGRRPDVIFSKSGLEWYENRYTYLELASLLKSYGLRIRKTRTVYINIPFFGRRSRLLRRYALFPLGRLLKIFANQFVVLAQKDDCHENRSD